MFKKWSMFYLKIIGLILNVRITVFSFKRSLFQLGDVLLEVFPFNEHNEF